MAIDQTPSASPAEPPPLPAIENEFPTYRAISSTAVLSLLFGLSSVFCFADHWFLLLVAAAVLLGVYSQRKIRQFPDVLTGAGLARVGIGVGLLFGLSSLTRELTEEVTINMDASQFAKFYIGVIKNEPTSVALWYQQSTDYRKAKSPDELIEELKRSKSPVSPDPYQEAAGPILKMKERIQSGQGDIQYSQIESKYVDGLTIYAYALIKVNGPGTKENPQTELFALFQLIKAPNGGRRDWIVKEVKFPYTPKSVIAAGETKHDEHGH